jgi:hypothetical protein
VMHLCRMNADQASYLLRSLESSRHLTRHSQECGELFGRYQLVRGGTG